MKKQTKLLSILSLTLFMSYGALAMDDYGFCTKVYGDALQKKAIDDEDTIFAAQKAELEAYRLEACRLAVEKIRLAEEASLAEYEAEIARLESWVIEAEKEAKLAEEARLAKVARVAEEYAAEKAMLESYRVAEEKARFAEEELAKEEELRAAATKMFKVRIQGFSFGFLTGAAAVSLIFKASS